MKLYLERRASAQKICQGTCVCCYSATVICASQSGGYGVRELVMGAPIFANKNASAEEVK